MRLKQLLSSAAVVGVLLALPLTTQADEVSYAIAPYLSSVVAESLAMDPDGHLAFVDYGTGDMNARIVRLSDLDGTGTIDNEAEMHVVAGNLPSTVVFDEEFGEFGIAGTEAAAFSPSGELYFITSTFWGDLTSDRFGAIWSTAAPNNSTNQLRVASPYASLAQYEVAMNPDGGDINPNPYRIAVDAAGNAYINDAGANVTLKVTPDGTISVFAHYPPVEIPEDFGLPFPFAEPVPTGIALGPDGALYTSQLVGFPFIPGAASVYRLADGNGDGDALDDGEMTMVAGGLTTVTDIAVGPDGAIYATEFRGFLTAEGEGPPAADGAVVKWTGSEWQTVASGLLMPTSVEVGADGTVYILTIDSTIWRAVPTS